MSFWQKPCRFCGDAIQTVGLDRIDNRKGYTVSNVVACCRTCNSMKSGQTVAAFIARCRRIAERS